MSEEYSLPQLGQIASSSVASSPAVPSSRVSFSSTVSRSSTGCFAFFDLAFCFFFCSFSFFNLSFSAFFKAEEQEKKDEELEKHERKRIREEKKSVKHSIICKTNSFLIDTRLSFSSRLFFGLGRARMSLSDAVDLSGSELVVVSVPDTMAQDLGGVVASVLEVGDL